MNLICEVGECKKLHGPNESLGLGGLLLKSYTIGEKSVIYLVLCRKTFKGMVHETDVYSVGVSPKSPTL